MLFHMYALNMQKEAIYSPRNLHQYVFPRVKTWLVEEHFQTFFTFISLTCMQSLISSEDQQYTTGFMQYLGFLIWVTQEERPEIQ